MFYKRLILLILLVIVISCCAIYYTVDISTFRHLLAFKPWSIAAAIFCVALGLFLDGMRLFELIHISHEKISYSNAAKVVFGNYFLALLTPGFSGGAVAQVMFLRHAKIPIGKATVIVVVRTLVSIIFLFLCMPFILLFDAGVVPWVSNISLLVFFIAMVLALGFLIFVIIKGYFDQLIIFIVKRFSPKKGRAILRFYRDNKSAIFLLVSSPLDMLKVFVLSGLSLLSLYSVVPCLLVGLGASINWSLVLGRMILLNLLLYFSPTPGGSGFAEGGFVILFQSMAPVGTVGVIAVVWRLFAEYIPFLIGFYCTIKTFGRSFLGSSLEKKKADVEKAKLQEKNR